MAATISALWLLLLYLLKDTELLDAQRDRLPGTDANGTLLVGSSDRPSPSPAGQEDSAFKPVLATDRKTRTRADHLGSGRRADDAAASSASGFLARSSPDAVASSIAWMTSASLDARVLPNATPADIVMLAEAAGFVVVLDILGNVSMAPSSYPESDPDSNSDPIGTGADITAWRKLSALLGARIKEDGDSVTALSVDAERQLVLLGTRYGVLHVVSISACAVLPPRAGVHGQPGGSPSIVYLGSVRKRFFQTIGKVPLSRTHIHASANVVVFADGAIYETTLDKQPRLIRKPEPLDRWTAFAIPLAALASTAAGSRSGPSWVDQDDDVHMLGLASTHARVSIWLHEAKLNRWTELAKLQLSVGHIVRATALIARGPKELPSSPEGVDFVGTARPPPGDGPGPKTSTNIAGTDPPPPSIAGQLTDSSLALLGTNTGRVLVYDLRGRQMVQVLEIGDGPVQRIMAPPTQALQSPIAPMSSAWGGNPSPPPPFVLVGLLTKSHVWFAKVYPDLVLESCPGPPGRIASHGPHQYPGASVASASSTSLSTSAGDLGPEERAGGSNSGTGSTPTGSMSKAAHLASLFGPANAKYGTHARLVRRGERDSEELSGPTNWADSGAMSGPGDGPNQITTPDGQTITLRTPAALAASSSSGSGGPSGAAVGAAGASASAAAISSDAGGSTGGSYPISTHGARSRRANSNRDRANSARALRAQSTSVLPPSGTGNGGAATHHGAHIPSAHMANVGMGLGLSLEGAPDKNGARDESQEEPGPGSAGLGADASFGHLPPDCEPSESPPSTPRRDLVVRDEPVRMAGSTGCVRGAADGVGRYVVGVRRQTANAAHALHPHSGPDAHPGARWQVFAVDLLADAAALGAGATEQRGAAAQAIALGGGGYGDEERLAFGSVRTVGSDAQGNHLIFSYGNSVAAIHVPPT